MTDNVQISLNDVSVCIGMPTKGDINPHTVMSLLQTTDQMAKMGVPLTFALIIAGSAVVGRDLVINEFLKSDATKLFWIDSDMVWSPDDFVRMLALSVRKDCVCAAYPLKRDGDTSFIIKHNGNSEPGEFGLIPVEGAGLGFTIVDRKVCEKLAENAPTIKDELSDRELKSVFRLDIFDGRRRTEDIAFFADVIDAGYEVLLDPSIELGHVGSKEWRGMAANALQ